MGLAFLRSVVSRRPAWVVTFWVVLAATVWLVSPDLTQLAAEGQANLMSRDAESLRAAEIVAQAWPDQSFKGLAVVALHRPGGLTPADHAFARNLVSRYEAADHPREILRVLGPNSPAEVADRLVSRDGTVSLIAIQLSASFVSPVSQEVVTWLQQQAAIAQTNPNLPGAGSQAADGTNPTAGLELRWSGDAVIGRDYMNNVQTSLDRAAIATVILLLGVLLLVYRSFWLSLVPLTTIGLSLIISRGILAWMNLAGWELSPLVELFLVALLFGSGTDFCLFISWRFGERWNPDDPAGVMEATLKRSTMALLTSAGTVIIGLSLMGTTRFKLFSSTGPSVAIGLALTLIATLTLTPALLVLLAGRCPRAFRGMQNRSTSVWGRLGRLAMARPALSWAGTLLFMAPMVILGLRTHMIQDLMSELPRATPSVETFRLLSDKFPAGMFAPLTIVLESKSDLRESEGLALIDDVSRFLNRQRRLLEVRSATQPLGSPQPLSRARIASRLTEVNDGFNKMVDGASRLRQGLNEGALKLRAAIWLEQNAGISVGAAPPEEPRDAARRTTPKPTPNMALATGFRRASAALLGTGIAGAWGNASPPAESASRQEPARETAQAPRGDDPRQKFVEELLVAADGAGQIADGAGRAHHEVSAILADPVGRRALDRLLINAETVRDHPELNRSFSTYITPDGHRTRIDVAQSDRVFSSEAMDSVESLRRRLSEYLDEADGPAVTVSIAGANAESADIRSLTRADQFQSWFVIPIGVFLVLLVALRDPLGCVNLVATMLLTYAFALGATHFLFVTCLGSEGLDWKVPYFLFVLLVAVGVDYNIFLMDRLREESRVRGLRAGIVTAIGQTGGLITSAAAITACSFASFLSSPLGSLRQLGFALVVGITIDAVVVRPILVPCGHWLLARCRDRRESMYGNPTHRPRSALARFGKLVRMVH